MSNQLTWLRRLTKRYLLPLICLSVTMGAMAQPRIISTNAGITDLLLAMQLDAALVGVDITSLQPEVTDLPKVGYHRMLSTEGLISLKPTHLLGSEAMGPESVLSTLKQSGVQVEQLPEADSARQIASNITLLARLFNQPAQGEQLLEQLNHQIDTIKKPATPLRIASLLMTDSSKLRLAGSNTHADHFIQLLGGQNVADFANYRNISTESLLAMQPDVILILTATADPKEDPVEQLLDAQPLLLHTPANAHNRIIAVDGSHLVAGLSLAAVEDAAKLSQQLTQGR